MCGRVTLTRTSASELADELGARFDPAAWASYRARYNAAPTDVLPHIVLAGGTRWMEPAVWGVEREVGGPRARLVINAMAERLESRTWREALAARRCVLVTDGFFEWRDGPGGRRPVWLHRPDGGLLYLACLYDEPDATGDARRFVVVTTRANALVGELHDRMPALLDEREVDAWLAAPRVDLLRPAPDDLLVATAVSPRANAVANDDPACIAAAADAPAPRQLDLFARR